MDMKDVKNIECPFCRKAFLFCAPRTGPENASNYKPHLSIDPSPGLELNSQATVPPEVRSCEPITSLEERLIFMREMMVKEIEPLTERKGHDYSGTVDSYSNLRDFGVEGIVVRIGDKYHRLKNYYHQHTLEVKEESVEETLIDLIVYSFIALHMQRGG